jgi:4-hydroxy-4-methyl-2-oxoglutarate aldolase
VGNRETTALAAFSSTVLSDALDTLGVNGGCGRISAITRGARCIGRAFTVKFEPVTAGERAPAADYIDEVPEGSVIVLDNAGITYCTVWGDILSYCAQQRGVAGTVIHGLCRDSAASREMNYPLFALGTYMKSGKNRVRMVAHSVPVTAGSTTIQPGDWIFGDDDGVLAIPSELVGTVLEVAERITGMEGLVRESISGGMPLAEARKLHGYNLSALQTVR